MSQGRTVSEAEKEKQSKAPDVTCMHKEAYAFSDQVLTLQLTLKEC